MSLTATLRTANSGMLAAQTGLRTVSDNIANVNTPGYVRKSVDQAQLAVGGRGMGVEILGVRRVTDQYLQLASLTAASDASRWDAVAEYLDNAQAAFGDPSSDSFFFNRLDEVWSAFAAAADDPSSSLARSLAISKVEDFFTEAGRINTAVDELGETVDARISAGISRANALLEQITRLNVDISKARLVSADASGSENLQSQLLDELSTLINIQVVPRGAGGVVVRTSDGAMLAGESAAVLTYNKTESSKGYITAQVGPNTSPIEVASGELRGLLELRNEKLPGIIDQLGEFVSRAAEEINRAHNASASYPAPAQLTGRNTGLDLPTAVGGFAGQTTIALVDAAGGLTRRIDVDFTAGSLSVDGGAATAFTPASFLATLNTAMGAGNSATFSGGVLQLSVATGGVAIDEGTSDKAGRAFSHFFGLNDLVQADGFSTYETGLTAADPHGLNAGGQIVMRLAQGDGKPLRDVTLTVPAGATMNDLLTALNASGTGVGLYGQFTLDSRGALSFAGSPPLNAGLTVVSDTTQRGVGGPSISQLFGLGAFERSVRAAQYEVAPAITSQPMRLALGRLDLTGPAGQPVLRPGDGRGSRLLSQAGDNNANFAAAGALGAVNMTITRYAAEFGGGLGREAQAAENRKSGAESVKSEAVARRQAVEGVNIDEELVRLTTYQQAFSASARMIQAASEMYDTLIRMI